MGRIEDGLNVFRSAVEYPDAAFVIREVLYGEIDLVPHIGERIPVVTLEEPLQGGEVERDAPGLVFGRNDHQGGRPFHELVDILHRHGPELAYRDYQDVGALHAVDDILRGDGAYVPANDHADPVHGETDAGVHTVVDDRLGGYPFETEPLLRDRTPGMDEIPVVAADGTESGPSERVMGADHYVRGNARRVYPEGPAVMGVEHHGHGMIGERETTVTVPFHEHRAPMAVTVKNPSDGPPPNPTDI